MGLLWCSSHRRGARARAARWLGLQIVTASRIAVLFGESIDSARLVGMGIPSRVRLPLPRNPGSHWVKVERAQGGCSISRRPYQRLFTHAQYGVIPPGSHLYPMAARIARLHEHGLRRTCELLRSPWSRCAADALGPDRRP